MEVQVPYPNISPCKGRRTWTGEGSSQTVGLMGSAVESHIPHIAAAP